MLTRMLVVVLLASAGCKEKEAAKATPAPVAKVEPLADEPKTISATEIAALKLKFQQLVDARDDVGSVPVAGQIVEGLRAVKPASTDLADAMVKYGMQLQVTGEWKAAQTILEEALAIPAAQADHALLSQIKFQLGALYSELRENDKATAILRSAVALASESYGPDSEQSTIMKESLASALDYQEDYQEAEKMFREILATYEKQKNELRIGRALANLAINLEFQDRDPEALKLLMRAVTALSKTEGYDRSGLAEAHAGIGRVQSRQKDYTAAQAAFRKAIATRIEAVGPDHPLVAMDYHNLASSLRDNHRLKEAREACAKSLAIRQAKLPADHPYRVSTETMCAELADAK